MIDFHCHLLPGVDDGSADLAESLEMAAILASSGFRDVCCTPHIIRGAFDNSREKIVTGVNALQQALDNARIAVRLRPAAEYYLDEHLLPSGESPLTLNDAGAILVEAPFQAETAIVTNLLQMVAGRGLVPLVAHPERCRAFAGLFDKPKASGWRIFNLFKTPDTEPAGDSLLATLRDAGCRFQGNIGSFAG
ncbi:MAG TPA: CpsB/CapC family capsule biosynthesis tyrosine phosphatase, partial [Geobacteraceae bacterium]|nr:CpsB/CapC family capsule biosynthesis tyrosine phosphatase [Geobacteraceae bacterium]